jgi:class 3 adenylate cyclase
VNTANRICRQATGGQILVSGAVAAQLGEGTAMGDPFPLQLKGITAPIEVIALKSPP